MDATPLAHDTDAAIEVRQIEAWRRMTPEQKLTLVAQMTAAVRDLALAGVRERFPEASPREQFLRLAQVTLGDALARQAYPELEQLDPK
ncbi:MAG TPA: hypothetical protein PLH72_10475 [Vicinamibacterales bacterium]|nr:hypothetical protein [Vicinamibacterales bacterium]